MAALGRTSGLFRFHTGHALPGMTDEYVGAVRSALTEASHRIHALRVQLLDCHYAAIDGQLTCTFAAAR